MIDSEIVGLAESVVEWVDDRYGRIAAWAAAIVAPVVILSVIMGLVVAGLTWLV